MGYHKQAIRRGIFGEISKIREELDELEDAHEQGVKILELVELSDLYGAIEAYVERRHGLTMDDVAAMSKLTRSAFESGERCSRSTTD